MNLFQNIHIMFLLQYTAYRFRAQSGKHLALRLCDMPGQGVTTYDMNYLLDGLVPENYKVSHLYRFNHPELQMIESRFSNFT